MSYEEAMAWLQGERSTWNTFAYMQSEGHLLAAQVDAAHTQQAYWTVRAHNEGLVADRG